MAGYLPPQPPSWTAVEVASFYRDHANSIRAGQIICMAAATLLIPWFAVIAIQMARSEGAFPIVAIIQLGSGLLLCGLFYLCSLIWIAATYRSDIDPGLIRAMHETSWLIFVMAAPEYVLQLFCIGISGFMDKSKTPWLPRWASFLNIWVAIGGGGGMFAVFFKNGPFAWNGIVGFWIPVVLFVIWLCVMVPLLIANVKRSAPNVSEVQLELAS